MTNRSKMSQERNRYMRGLEPFDERKGWLKGRGILTGRFVDNIFKASLLYHILKPKNKTGNEINGLGEHKFRFASKAYHWLFSDSKNYPMLFVNWIFVIRSKFNKESQQFGFGELFKENLNLMKATIELNNTKLDQNCQKIKRSPEQWSEIIKQKGKEFGAGDIGIALVSDEMRFENKAKPGKYVIVIAEQMNYETSQKLPGAEGSCATMRAYLGSNKVGYKLASWLRTQGIEAKGSHLLPEKLVVPPAAIKAGLGQLGKHGSIIHPKFGSLVRFNYVAVDIDLVEDGPIDFGVDEFCASCEACSRNCPPQAMYPDKQMVRGNEKWYVDLDKCLPYFNDVHGCGRCLVVCPWSQPGAPERMIANIKQQKEMLVDIAHAAKEKRGVAIEVTNI